MRPTQGVGGLYVTVAGSLAPLLININNNNKIFRAISNCGKQKRSSQIFCKVSGVFQQDFNGTKNSDILQPRTGQFRGIVSSRTCPMCPRGCVLEDVLEAKDVLEDSTSVNLKLICFGRNYFTENFYLLFH